MSGGTSYTGTGTMYWQPLFNAYNSYAAEVNSKMSSLGNQTAGAINMVTMFQLQTEVSVMSMFGQTVTNVISSTYGVSDRVAQNLKT